MMLIYSIEEGEGAGQFTLTGTAVMGLHSQNYNVAMAQANKYADELARLNKEIANDPSNTKLLNRREELLKLQRESILAAENEKNAISDMVEDGIKLELEALSDLIDKYSDSLDEAKDLYDYQKKIKNQTYEVASLEKQLLAYSEDNSEESRAVKQKLKVELSEARENLQEAQYDHFVSEQKKLLDDFYDDYEGILNQRLDNIDALISDMIAYANTNAVSICKTIEAESKGVGYSISDDVMSIWKTSGIPIATIYDKNFGKASTTVNRAVGNVTFRVNKYASGGLIDYTGIAQVDGSPNNPELVLSPSDTANFIALKDAMQKAAAGDGVIANLFSDYSASGNILKQLARLNAIPNSAPSQIGSVTYQVNIPIERVLDYNDFVNQLTRDNRFEKFLQAATTDRLTGGSKIAKTKYRW